MNFHAAKERPVPLARFRPYFFPCLAMIEQKSKRDRPPGDWFDIS